MYPETFFSNEQNDILNLLKHNPKHQATKQPKGAVIAPQFANKFDTGKSFTRYTLIRMLLKLTIVIGDFLSLGIIASWTNLRNPEQTLLKR